ncbi:hypothetical protein PIB30_046384 [Stylosanthes scabra]|uniref:Uncharacterized protein n=1 Tax=Stylosanthes scabra TaxID=79078 RepID=A0ABU6QFV5_9FABA|nr:hypothetical protein [Stylosanthes scabra]
MFGLVRLLPEPPLWSGYSCPRRYCPAASFPLPTATKKGGSSKDPAGKPFPVQGEEGAKEDPSADLKKKGRKRKAPGASTEEAALGTDSSWVHKLLLMCISSPR